ncbi:hypothetical protein V5O48_004566, partial [Marasmius crinis-equi]
CFYHNANTSCVGGLQYPRNHYLEHRRVEGMTNYQGIFLCHQCHEQREANNVRPLHALDSRFANSKYSPSETEIGELKAALAEEESELARYRKEIAVLREKLRKLETEEEILKKHVGHYHSALSVQRRVPTEIWEIIFAVVCTSEEDGYSLDVDCEYPWDREEDGHARSIIKASAITLSHVCSRWKSIVNDCARLWSSIRIQFAAPADITDLLRAYLDRSKAYPLSLQLVFGSPEDEYDSEDPLPEDKLEAWRLLVPHLQRCRALVLGVADMDVFSTPAGGLPFLNLVSFRNLAFDWYDQEELLMGSPQPTWLSGAICRAPQLADVAMRYLMPRDTLPYHRLTSPAIEYVDMDAVQVLFDLLPTWTALASLKLGQPALHGGSPSLSPLGEPIEVPSLRHLDLGDEGLPTHPDYSVLSLCCRKLKLPSLTSFSIRCGGWSTALPALLRCSTATLERVRIRLYCPTESTKHSLDSILPMLQSLSRLTHLELMVKSYGSSSDMASCVIDFLTALFAKPEPEEGRITFLLPRLQAIHLTFSDVMMTTEVLERMLAVVSSRLGASNQCSLTEFCFAQSTPNAGTADSAIKLVLDEAILEKMTDFGHRGLRVVFAKEPW